MLFRSHYPYQVHGSKSARISSQPARQLPVTLSTCAFMISPAWKFVKWVFRIHLFYIYGKQPLPKNAISPFCLPRPYCTEQFTFQFSLNLPHFYLRRLPLFPSFPLDTKHFIESRNQGFICCFQSFNVYNPAFGLFGRLDGSHLRVWAFLRSSSFVISVTSRWAFAA